MDLSLIAPNGDLAEFNLPQGVGNYGNAQVADPAPGQWTALVSTSSTASSVPASVPGQHGYLAPVRHLSASSVTLAPGASRTIGLTVATPSRPGDQAGSHDPAQLGRRPRVHQGDVGAGHAALAGPGAEPGVRASPAR